MLTATDEALKHLAEFLSEGEATEGSVMRCISKGGTLTLRQDSEQPGDTVFQLDDRPILVVGRELAAALDGREFDVETTAEGTRLTL